MTRWIHKLQLTSLALGLGVAVTACALPPAAATAQNSAAAPTTTVAAADAPHPTRVLPGVRVGVQLTTVSSTPLADLPHPSVAGTTVREPKTAKPVKTVAVDGCNRAYGTAAQCVPFWAPGHRVVTCAYLRQGGYFRTPLVVVSDPLRLMNKNNVRTGATRDGKYATISGCTD